MSWDDFDDWGPYEDHPVKEEPDCPPCGDTGRVGRRNCKSCNPTVVQHLWWLLTWRIRWQLRRLGDRLRGNQYDEEAPF